MTETGSNIDMFTNPRSIRDGDIEEGNGERDIINIDELAISLARMLDDVPHYMGRIGHPGRISKIPDNLREVEAKPYEPFLVSIGPYHNGKPSVLLMEHRKLFVLKCFLQQNPEITLKDYLKEISVIEPEARSFYSDVDMDSEEFV